MSYDSANLTTPDIKWLGVRPSDLNRFNIPKQCRIKMTDEDIKTGKKMVCPSYCNDLHRLVDCTAVSCVTHKIQLFRTPSCGTGCAQSPSCIPFESDRSVACS